MSCDGNELKNPHIYLYWKRDRQKWWNPGNLVSEEDFQIGSVRFAFKVFKLMWIQNRPVALRKSEDGIWNQCFTVKHSHRNIRRNQFESSLSIGYFIRIISNMWSWMIFTIWSSHTSHNVPEWTLIIIMTVSSLCLTKSIFWKCFRFTHVESTDGFQWNRIMIIDECCFSKTKEITMDRMNSFPQVKIPVF